MSRRHGTYASDSLDSSVSCLDSVKPLAVVEEEVTDQENYD